MSNVHRFKSPIVLGVLVMSMALILEPTTAASQEMKRGAGSMSRSAGSTSRGSDNRRGNSLGSSKRGPATSMKSERKSTSSDDKKWDSKKDKSKDDDEDDSSSSRFGEEEEDEEVDFGGRTLGRACMYGVNDEVIFRPEGSVCRGDAPPPSRAKKRKKKGALAPPEPLSASAPAAATPAPLRSRTGASAPARKIHPAQRARTRKPRIGAGKPKGCIFAKDGSVLHAPSGIDCD